MENIEKIKKQLDKTTKELNELKKEIKNIIEGFGVLVLHGTRLDVDESARISDLNRKITNITNRLEYIESVTGSEEEEPEGIPVEQIRLGNYRFFAPGTTPYRGEVHNGNTLFLERDQNDGLTVTPDWGTYPKEKWTP
jgi:hypothetical protein